MSSATLTNQWYKRNLKLVYGYIRNLKITQQIIPLSIIDLCVIFYYTELEKVSLSKEFEKQKYYQLAELYSIIVTMEHLEKQWARGCCTDDEYTDYCQKLIIRY